MRSLLLSASVVSEAHGEGRYEVLNKAVLVTECRVRCTILGSPILGRGFACPEKLEKIRISEKGRIRARARVTILGSTILGKGCGCHRRVRPTAAHAESARNFYLSSAKFLGGGYPPHFGLPLRPHRNFCYVRNCVDLVICCCLCICL